MQARKKVLNNAFFTRFHRPGLERLLACHTFIHLIRAIGHHIDRFACRSVSIMVCLSAHSVRRFAKSRIGGEQKRLRTLAFIHGMNAGGPGFARVGAVAPVL
jgi:hypothetical protein